VHDPDDLGAGPGGWVHGVEPGVGGVGNDQRRAVGCRRDAVEVERTGQGRRRTSERECLRRPRGATTLGNARAASASSLAAKDPADDQAAGTVSVEALSRREPTPSFATPMNGG
jgi:hypothetical protein